MNLLQPKPNNPVAGSSEAEKLDYEIRVMNAFQRLRPDLGIEIVSGLMPPAPDFEITSHGRVVGVEHTRLVESKSKAKEREQDKVVANAEQMFGVEHPNICLNVIVYWHDNPTVTEIRNNGYDKDLAQLVAANLPSAGEFAELHWEDMPAELWSVFHAVHIHGRRIRDPHWYSPRAGFVQDLRPHEIIEQISSKQGKLAGYRTYFNEVWLLIAHDGGGPSSFGELSRAVSDHTYETGFDRVFLMPMTPPDAVELKITPARLLAQ